MSDSDKIYSMKWRLVLVLLWFLVLSPYRLPTDSRIQRALDQIQTCSPRTAEMLRVYVRSIAWTTDDYGSTADVHGNIRLTHQLESMGYLPEEDTLILMATITHEARHNWQVSNLPPLSRDESAELDANAFARHMLNDCSAYVTPRFKNYLASLLGG